DDWTKAMALSSAYRGKHASIILSIGAAGAPSRCVRQYRTGAIYLFVRPATGWSNMTQTFRGIGSDGDRNEMGSSVAFVGNSTVVGRRARASNFTGAAYIL